MKKENRTRFEMGWLKKVINGGISSFLFVLGLGIIFNSIPIKLAMGQTPTSSSWTTKPVNRDWWMRVLWLHGFPDFLRPESFPALKASLNLTDKEMEAIKSLSDLYERYREVESHLDDPYKGNPLLGECVEGAIQLRNTLGNEKFDDFCEWAWEDLVIFKSTYRLLRKNSDLNNTDNLADQLLKEIKDSKSYAKYKKDKTTAVKAGGSADKYFSNHDKVLKLRILHELYENQKPVGGWNSKNINAQKLKRKRKEILNPEFHK